MAYFIDGKDCMVSDVQKKAVHDVTNKRNPRQVTEWMFLIVAYAFVALRIYTHLFYLRKRLGWSEILLIASALDALGLIVCDTLTFQMGVLDDYKTSETLSKVRVLWRAWTPHIHPLSSTFIVPIVSVQPTGPMETIADTCNSKISFASNYFYDFGLGLPKLSMLAFYWTFFDLKHHRAVRKCLLPMTAFVVVCYCTSLFDDTFFCGKDVSVQWSQEEGACSVFYAQEPFILNFTLGLTCYLIIYTLPTILLIQGILETSAAVILTLAVGMLPILTGIVRFICLKVGTGQENLVCKFEPLLYHHSSRNNPDTTQISSAWWN